MLRADLRHQFGRDMGVLPVSLLRKFSIAVAAIGLCVGLSACGGSGISNVPVVGKMFGGEKKTAAQVAAEAWSPTKPQTPSTRAIQVAWTAMKAQKCGFNFNAPALRTAFLTAEARTTADPAALTKAQTAYDYTAKNISGRIGPIENYCTPARTRRIKADLKRHLSGDFSAPTKIKKAKVAYETENTVAPIDNSELFGKHWDE